MNDSHHAAGKVIRRPLRLREAGFTFAEMAFAFLIIVVVSMALMNHMSLIYRRNAIEKDKVFAYSKASAILAELQSYVNRTEDAAANSLDIFDDGASHNLTLTIAEDSGGPVAPDHPLSGNTKRMEEWGLVASNHGKAVFWAQQPQRTLRYGARLQEAGEGWRRLGDPR
jgi:Tfp pilus assembly protein PilX